MCPQRAVPFVHESTNGSTAVLAHFLIVGQCKNDITEMENKFKAFVRHSRGSRPRFGLRIILKWVLNN
jgi:hypothetical protein